MFFMDYWYIVLVLPAVLLTLVAQMMVKSTFNKYSKIGTRSGMTGLDACVMIQRQNGLNLPINMIQGSMTDNFDPRSNTINLSATVGPVPSIAAIGVAAHETGHAMQHAGGYLPIKIRSGIVPVTRVASAAAPWLVMAGLVFSSLLPLAYVGVAFFGMAVLFQLVTLPVEFDASRRAIKSLESQQILTAEELAGARKVLTAAAMTYVAALFLSMMSMIRLLLIVSGRGRRR